jgi:TRAP-type C4-dicarboxylate transport system permease small subunit
LFVSPFGKVNLRRLYWELRTENWELITLMMMPKTQSPRPRWIAIPVRVVAVTFLLTLLSFAVALLLSLLGTIVYSQVKHVAPNLPFAYRHIAFPFAMTVGAIVLILSLVMEIRNYRQRRTLAGIERAS